MDSLQLVVLALVQGLTEFLPISSSAHLILVPVWLGWPDQGLAFDVAVHVGTLLAVTGYFRREILEILRALLAIPAHGPSPQARLGLAVAVGTVPVGLAGLLLGDLVETVLRSPLVIATSTVVFGLLLGLADRRGGGTTSEYALGWRAVLWIGLAQALALIPGTSRSGITITAGLWLGLSASAAARFSFLLSIPVIVLAGGLKTLELLSAPGEVDPGLLVGGALLAGVSAYLCIGVFLRVLPRLGMLPFVIYRVLLGGLLFAVFL